MAKNFGEKILVGLGLISLISCAPIYAKRDYARYPQHKKEIANYNIEKILDNICRTSGFVGGGGFGCNEGCTSSTPIKTQFGSTIGSYCHTYYHGFSRGWDEIKSISVEDDCVKFNDSKECDIEAKNNRQANDLKEAVEIYLKER